MISLTELENFKPIFEVVSCYLENNGDILLLHRHAHKPEGNTWGLPAGKIDNGEDKAEAIVREVREETGLETDSSQFEYLDKLYVRYPGYDFIYYMFKLNLEQRPDIKISAGEHQEYKWMTPKEALNLELIKDLDNCIKMSYGGKI